MPEQRRSRKRLRWWERPADGTLARILEILLHRDALALMAALIVLIVSTPWLLLVLLSLAAAGALCALLVRYTYRKGLAVDLQNRRPLGGTGFGRFGCCADGPESWWQIITPAGRIVPAAP
jgi:hypothetical protein